MNRGQKLKKGLFYGLFGMVSWRCAAQWGVVSLLLGVFALSGFAMASGKNDRGRESLDRPTNPAKAPTLYDAMGIPADWYHPGWRWRKRFTIDNSAQASGLDDFPVLIRLDGAQIDYARTQDQGQDLRFVNSDGSLLSHEIEVWDESGVSIVWVKIPRINGGSTNGAFWLYYDNPSVADGQDSADVWSNGYAGVWHLNDLLDSTNHNNDGSNNGTLVDTGAFGFGRRFNGNDWINMGNGPSMQISDEITMEAWVSLTSANQNAWMSLISKKDRWFSSTGFEMEYNPRGDWLLVHGAGSDYAWGRKDIDTNWHYLTGTIDGAFGRAFFDGSENTIDSTTGAPAPSTENLSLGRRSGGNDALRGILDEVRISNVERSPDYFAAQYLSMTDAFLTCDPPESICAAIDDDCDGVDDDCDGIPDDDFVSTPTSCGVGECAGNSGALVCAGGVLADTCDPVAGATSDANCDALDNDCDGAADEDYVSTATTCGVGECAGNGGSTVCAAGVVSDTCDPFAGATSDANCDGLDNDCDGAADEDYVSTATTCGVGECAGNGGSTVCAAGVVSDTCDPFAGATSDANCDALDNDCDGAADEDYVSTPTTCGVGECAGNSGSTVCAAGVVNDTCDPFAGAAAESCDTLDNDCDGTTDEDGVCTTGPTPAPRLETGLFLADGSPQTVALMQNYADPVVVVTVQYDNNTIPVVARVSNATSSSFDVRLQNPANASVVADWVHYIVVERGSWVIDGTRIEAQTYNSSLTDHDQSWLGEAQSYLQGYTSPVVVGQVMTENDPEWSFFWSSGTLQSDAPSSSVLNTGKAVAEDPLLTRADERVGFIVFEAAHSYLGGIEFEAALGRDVIGGVTNGAPYFYAFGARFSADPQVAILSGAGMDGVNGGWAQTFGTDPLSDTLLYLTIDEDQLQDTERDHTTEAVAYLVFERPFAYEPAPCLTDSECDDSLFCTGNESCAAGYCSAGTPPCFDFSCDDATDTCLVGPAPLMESFNITAFDIASTVPLTNTYLEPVIACTAQYANNVLPFVVRVSNVTGTSFDVRLQNPSDAPLVSENVGCLVVEEGVWTLDGVRISAQRFTSSLTAHDAGWIGEATQYGQLYSAPVVLGQVMTENDPAWSVFWNQGASRDTPPAFPYLVTGKTVCEDPDITRAPEDIGVIIIETGHGILSGVEYEAGLGLDSVRGVQGSPPYAYTFSTPFTSAPRIVLGAMAAVDGGNGGWAQVHGTTLSTTTQTFFSIDEDQAGDVERSHTTEQVGYLAFEGPFVYVPAGSCSTDFDCDDGNFCNGVDVCIAGSCDVIPVDCDPPDLDP